MAGEWLAKNSKVSEPKIMMRHEGVEFYSDGFTVYTPQGLTIPQTTEYAKKNRVDYLVAWTEELSDDQDFSLPKPVFKYPENFPKIIIYQIP